MRGAMLAVTPRACTSDARTPGESPGLVERGRQHRVVRTESEPLCWSGLGVALATAFALTACTPKLEHQEDTHDGTAEADTGSNVTESNDTDPPLTLVADDVDGWVLQGDMTIVDGLARISDDGESIEGTVSYEETEDGVATCIAGSDFIGTRYESTCEDCDFAFGLEAEWEPDVDGDDCIPSPVYTFVENDDWVNPVLAFAESIDMSDPFYENWTTLYNVTFISFDPGNEYVWWVPYYEPLTWTGESSYCGEASYADQELQWHLDLDFRGETWAAYQDCGTVEVSNATSAYAGHAVAGSLSCPGDYADGWAVDLQEGDLLSVSVDTLEQESHFRPDILVNDPTGCTVLVASTNFVCTSDIGRDDASHCPSGTVRVAEAGQYTIWVEGLAACEIVAEGQDAQYQLFVDRK